MVVDVTDGIEVDTDITDGVEVDTDVTDCVEDYTGVTGDAVDSAVFDPDSSFRIIRDIAKWA